DLAQCDHAATLRRRRSRVDTLSQLTNHADGVGRGRAIQRNEYVTAHSSRPVPPTQQSGVVESPTSTPAADRPAHAVRSSDRGVLHQPAMTEAGRWKDA